jgi:uridine phosphorylase
MPANFPIYPDKYSLTPLLSADDMIEFRRKQGGLGSIAAPRSIVICLYNGVMRRFPWRHPSRRVPGFLGDVYLLKRTGGTVGVLGNFGIGAPAITSVADEMMALAPGSIVVADRAFRDEGTSYHYLSPARDVQGSPQLAAALIQSLAARGFASTTGAVWSTDAPYRETRQEVELFQKEGASAVDMESAGVFAAAQVRGRQAASVFIIGDNLAGPRWSAPLDMRALHLRIRSVLSVLIDALAGQQ